GWPVKLAEGRDFVMQPRWHIASDRIAWVTWDHPLMPWDGTELWLAGFDATGGAPRLRDPHRIAGDRQTAIFQPAFSPDRASIAYISDQSGWTQLYLRDLDSGETRQLTHGEAEHGRPAWSQGVRTFAFVDGGRAIFALRSEGGYDAPQLVDTRTVEERPAPLDAGGYGIVEQPNAPPDGARVAAIASGPGQPQRVVSWELDGTQRVWARAMGETIP